MIPLAVRQQFGITQIEVLIGIVLTATLVIGLVGLWSLVDEQFQRLQWRQKAVFELNAQTERLAALYRHTNFLGEAGRHADGGVTVGRWIYREDPSPSEGTVSGLVVAENHDADVDANSFGERQILHMDYPGPPTASSHTNTIWLDRDNLVTAELAWEIAEIDVPPPACWRNSCYFMTVSLSFPYRLVAGTAAMVAEFGEIETLQVRTMVARRASTYD
ncbi:MAG: hypothetical protein H6980_06765 [Gammaproteobacteria bacterium]|nr:hypothetical protein [Gammaproteobacteria bacterium]